MKKIKNSAIKDALEKAGVDVKKAGKESFLEALSQAKKGLYKKFEGKNVLIFKPEKKQGRVLKFRILPAKEIHDFTF